MDDSRVVGTIQETTAGADDTLLDIARREDLGYWDIVLANPGVDVWLPGEGTRVSLPRRFILPDAPREGIVVNVPEMRLYYYPPRSENSPGKVITHPVGIGRQDWDTPLGLTKVTDKIPKPTWYPPASIRKAATKKGKTLPPVVPPGPDNPLGEYVLVLDRKGYLIHGTNRPAGVGMRVSHGCMRLYPEDIASLFPRIPRGTPVRIVNQPIKTTWHRKELLAETHPLPADDDYKVLHVKEHRALAGHLREVLGERARTAGLEVATQRLAPDQVLLNGVPQRVPLSRTPTVA
ncbi:MAG: L,D-transpeptidase family protein [Ectothiorhodospiraceae bacterium]|jgi:L,D-transpeptidase ErfK/SrfK